MITCLKQKLIVKVGTLFKNVIILLKKEQRIFVNLYNLMLLCKIVLPLLTVNTLQVEDNGIISFDRILNQFTPLQLPLSVTNFIAPYWCDVDTSGTGQVYYRQTNDSILLDRATNDIQSVLLSENVVITNLFIVTWNAVGYFDINTDKVR